MTSGSSTPDRAAAITATLRRLCGLIGVCWSLMTIQIVGWVLISAEPTGITRDLLIRLLEVQGISLLSTGLVTLILLPRQRSFDTRGKPGVPSPWPLMLAGMPMLPFALLAASAGRRPALIPTSSAAPLGDALRHVTVAFAAISAVTAAASAAHVVIHGDLDYRVPLEQGLATFTALQRKNIESRLLRFPDENHWVLKPANTLQWHEEVARWLNAHTE